MSAKTPRYNRKIKASFRQRQARETRAHRHSHVISPQATEHFEPRPASGAGATHQADAPPRRSTASGSPSPAALPCTAKQDMDRSRHHQERRRHKVLSRRAQQTPEMKYTGFYQILSRAGQSFSIICRAMRAARIHTSAAEAPIVCVKRIEQLTARSAEVSTSALPPPRASPERFS